MNLELFDAAKDTTDGTTLADVAVSAAPGPGSDIPSPILALEVIYHAEIAQRADMAQKEAVLNSQMSAAFPIQVEAIDLGGREGVGMNRERFGVYAERVEAYAQHALSAVGAPFTGTLHTHVCEAEDRFRTFYGRDSEKSAQAFAWIVEHFSPVAMWRQISKAFDPDAQRHAANHVAANKIRNALGVYRNRPMPEMKFVKGRVEMQMGVFTKQSYSDLRRLSYGCDLHELGPALMQALRHNGIEGKTFGQAFASMCQRVTEPSGRAINSRERVDLGDGVELVTGYEHFKLYMPQEFADAVNMFLAEYPATYY